VSYGIIYCITNKTDNNKYIGLTTIGLNERFKQHTKAYSYIGKAIRKHGKDNFTIEQIDEAETKEELCDLEIYWIGKHNTFDEGYNLTRGGEGVNNSYRIIVNLNEKQKQFIQYIREVNREKVDVNNTNQLMQFTMLYMAEIYINSDIPSVKKKAAELIYKLKPKYREYIEHFEVIDFEELKSYL